MPRYVDSVDKIVLSYFVALTAEEFTYKGKLYTPKPLYLSPTLMRTVQCELGCGACCPRFSLDYLSSEDRPDTEKRTVTLNSKDFEIYSDLQEDNERFHCRYLSRRGTCEIHGIHPFSCDFEMLRVMTGKERNRLQKSIFPRGWNMTQVNGEKGVHCRVVDNNDGGQETIRKLQRLGQWMRYFGLKKNHIGNAIRCIEENMLPVTILGTVEFKTRLFPKEG